MLRGDSIVCRDGHSLTEAHYTVLQNSSLVAPYTEEHKNILSSKYPEQNEDWITREQTRTFTCWLQTRVMHDADIEDDLYLLSPLPSLNIKTFKGYEINENTFYTIAQDQKSTNQNCGVCLMQQQRGERTHIMVT